MQSPTNGMTAIGPPWSQLTAYDLNTGEIKWQVPDGGVTPPPGSNVNIPADSGSHMPRGGPLVTGGGLVFVATASDRTIRAYDRDNGKVVWKTDLPTGSEGVPASYEVAGRQFIVFPVAAGLGLFPTRFGGPAPAARGAGEGAAAGGGPEAQAGAVVAAAQEDLRRTRCLHRVRAAAEVEGDDAAKSFVLGLGGWRPPFGRVAPAGAGPDRGCTLIAPGDWPYLNRDLAATRYLAAHTDHRGQRLDAGAGVVLHA